MIDYLQNLCRCNAVNCLLFFVVIHQYHTFATSAHKISSGKHTDIMPVFVHHREIPVTNRGHCVHDILKEIIKIKGYKMVEMHYCLDRDTLVYEPCSCISIKRRADDNTFFFFGFLQNLLRHLNSVSHYEAGAFLFDGYALGNIAVA